MTTQDRDHRYSFHVYAKKAAFTVHESSTKSKNTPTVSFDGTHAIAEKSYDWDKKISFQLTHPELLKMLYLCLGYIKVAKFEYHGQSKDKFLEVKSQEKGLYFQLTQKGRPAIGVPFTLLTHSQLTALCLSQYAKSIRVPQSVCLSLIEKQAFLFRVGEGA